MCKSGRICNKVFGRIRRVADERCSPAVLDFLRSTYVGRAAPPVEESDEEEEERAVVAAGVVREEEEEPGG